VAVKLATKQLPLTLLSILSITVEPTAISGLLSTTGRVHVTYTDQDAAAELPASRDVIRHTQTSGSGQTQGLCHLTWLTLTAFLTNGVQVMNRDNELQNSQRCLMPFA